MTSDFQYSTVLRKGKCSVKTNSVQSDLLIQEELERPESSFTEEETDDEDEVEEQEGRSEKKQSRTQSRVLLTPTQPVRRTLMETL